MYLLDLLTREKSDVVFGRAATLLMLRLVLALTWPPTHGAHRSTTFAMHPLVTISRCTKRQTKLKTDLLLLEKAPNSSFRETLCSLACGSSRTLSQSYMTTSLQAIWILSTRSKLKLTAAKSRKLSLLTKTRRPVWITRVTNPRCFLIFLARPLAETSDSSSSF